MKVGMELDALIAEKVMKWVKAYSPKLDKDMWYEYLTDTRMMSTKAVDDFYPSEDIRDAWLVVEKFRREGYAIEILYIDKVYVELRETPHIPEIEVAAETAPLAICLAALKAVGVEVE